MGVSAVASFLLFGCASAAVLWCVFVACTHASSALASVQTTPSDWSVFLAIALFTQSGGPQAKKSGALTGLITALQAAHYALAAAREQAAGDATNAAVPEDCASLHPPSAA